MIVTVHEAKSQLSKLIKAVEAGEEVIIARQDKPVVTLRKYDEKPPKVDRSRGAGGLRGHLSEEAVEYLTNNPALDKQIEDDFYAFEREEEK